MDKVKLPDVKTKNTITIPQEKLRKYIMYARQYIHPKMNDQSSSKIVNFYAELRKASEVIGGLQIAVRHLESIIRMAEGILLTKPMQKCI